MTVALHYAFILHSFGTAFLVLIDTLLLNSLTPAYFGLTYLFPNRKLHSGTLAFYTFVTHSGNCLESYALRS